MQNAVRRYGDIVDFDFWRRKDGRPDLMANPPFATNAMQFEHLIMAFQCRHAQLGCPSGSHGMGVEPEHANSQCFDVLN